MRRSRERNGGFRVNFRCDIRYSSSLNALLDAIDT